MEEQKKLQVAPVFNQTELEKKSTAWGKFGAQLYRTEITLQLQAQDIIKQLITEALTTPEKIKQAEDALAQVRKLHRGLQQNRISVTSNFDPVVSRLMQPEKDITNALLKNEDAILKAKLALKEAAKTQEAKDKELREVESKVQIYVADMHAAALNAQLALLSRAYEHALNTSVPISELPEFKTKLCRRVNLENCVTPMPKITAQYNTQAVIDAEIKKHFNPWPPQDYVNGFAADVETKFSDWEQALQNKEAAKELHEKEATVTTEAINEQLGKQKLSAGLAALSAPITEQADVKPLKEQWKINEPATMDQAFAIINAFAVNRNLVEEKLRKISPVNLGVKQMIAALVAVKTADQNFECTGIEFLKIDKL